MKHKHSLKEGMIINPPSVSEKSAVFSLAKSLGFKFEDCGQGFKMITPIIFYKGVITNRFFDRSVSTSIPYKAVTFIEFVTAMLTPEKDTPDYSEGDALLKEHLEKREKDTHDNDSAQAEERTQGGEPKELDEKEPENFFDKEIELFWKSLRKPTIEHISLGLTPKDYMTKKQYIRHLEAEVETLKQKLTEAEGRTQRGEPKETQGRVLSSDEIQKKEEDFKRMKSELQDQMPEYWSSERKMAQAKKVFHSMEQDLENDKLKLQIETLKQKLAETEKKESMEEDRRVDFGNEVTFCVALVQSHESAFIGYDLAKEGDTRKVLIATPGYTFKIREDYYEGRPALEIHRL